MTSVVDVMSRQVKQPQQPATGTPPINYRKNYTVAHGVHFIFDCAKRLDAKSVTSCSAAIIYHKFYRFSKSSKYDPYIIAGASLFISGKENSEKYTLRDVVNVCYHTLHPNSEPLTLNDTYPKIKDALIEAELFVLRMISFQFTFIHPHKYMLYYLIALEQWTSNSIWKKCPIPHLCWSLLHDFYHHPRIIDLEPQTVAIAIIYLALQCYSIQVPAAENLEWYKIIQPGVTLESIQDIIGTIIQVYDREAIFK